MGTIEETVKDEILIDTLFVDVHAKSLGRFQDRAGGRLIPGSIKGSTILLVDKGQPPKTLEAGAMSGAILETWIIILKSSRQGVSQIKFSCFEFQSSPCARTGCY